MADPLPLKPVLRRFLDDLVRKAVAHQRHVPEDVAADMLAAQLADACPHCGRAVTPSEPRLHLTTGNESCTTATTKEHP